MHSRSRTVFRVEMRNCAAAHTRPHYLFTVRGFGLAGVTVKKCRFINRVTHSANCMRFHLFRPLALAFSLSASAPHCNQYARRASDAFKRARGHNEQEREFGFGFACAPRDRRRRRSAEHLKQRSRTRRPRKNCVLLDKRLSPT